MPQPIMKKYKHGEMGAAYPKSANEKLDEKYKQPSLKIFSNCVNLIRTLPLLPLDKNNPEDVDTNAEDHAYDALRYGVMSRPMHPSITKELFEKSKVKSFKPVDRVFGY